MTDYPSAQLVLAHLLYEDHDGSWSLDELARELRFGPSSSRTPPRLQGGSPVARECRC